MKRLVLMFCFLELLGGHSARAAEADLNCLTGISSTGAPIYLPASPTNPCPVTITGGGGGSITVTPVVNVLTQTGGNVTAGNTFQTVLAANTARKSCLLENTSTHTGYVYFGTLGSATLGNAVQVAPGGTAACGAVNGPVSQQAVNFTTSTTSDTWVVSEGQ